MLKCYWCNQEYEPDERNPLCPSCSGLQLRPILVTQLHNLEIKLQRYSGAKIHLARMLLGGIRINLILIKEDGLTDYRKASANNMITKCKEFLGCQ